jgi:hypothetical protein
MKIHLVAACLAFGAMSAHARPVVVELFTSQGCSSCPPADAVLARLSTQKEVIAISWPVTYWDKLGWKDTLARPGNTQRQYRYAAAMQANGVYTPQAVIDGVIHVVGSQQRGLQQEITARQNRRAPIAVSLARTRTGMLQIATSASSTAVDVRFVLLKASATVAVGRGENSQHNLSYTNIATADSVIASGKSGQTLVVPIPIADRVAVLIEDRKTHAILAGALLDLK